MSDIVIGTCSICSGPVCLAGAWMSVKPQTPRCKHCGAEPEKPFGPVIPMKKKCTNTIAGVPKNKLFWLEAPGDTEVVELPGGGWGSVIKKRYGN